MTILLQEPLKTCGHAKTFVRGPAEANLVIVEFPISNARTILPTLKSLVEEYHTKVKWVLQNY